LRRSEKRGGHAETSFKFRSKFHLDGHLHAVIPLRDKNRQNAAAASGPICLNPVLSIAPYTLSRSGQIWHASIYAFVPLHFNR